MGMFKEKVRFSNSKDASRFLEEEFWVDTGALYSFIPEEYLQRIGVDADPVQKKLKPILAVIGGFLASQYVNEKTI